MIVLRANHEMKTTFERLIYTVGENVEWDGNFVVIDNYLILNGRVRSLFFNFDNRKVVSNVIELSIQEKDILDVSEYPKIQNILNMILYAFGKWGTIKGLKVEKDEKQLNALFKTILQEINVQPDYSWKTFVFFQNGMKITYEDVIQIAVEDKETPIVITTEDDKNRQGLWHKLIWKKQKYSFAKMNISEKQRNEHRLGKNYYMVGYMCPKCRNNLHMIVFPMSAPQKIDTEEGQVKLARAYVCDDCGRFFTPRPELLLVEGDVYEMQFDGDRKAYEDYLELLGKNGSRVSNTNFNQYVDAKKQQSAEQSQDEQRQEPEVEKLQAKVMKNATEEQFKDMVYAIPTMENAIFEKFTEMLDGGYYPEAMIQKYQKLIRYKIAERKAQKEKREQRERGERLESGELRDRKEKKEQLESGELREKQEKWESSEPQESWRRSEWKGFGKSGKPRKGQERRAEREQLESEEPEKLRKSWERKGKRQQEFGKPGEPQESWERKGRQQQESGELSELCESWERREQREPQKLRELSEPQESWERKRKQKQAFGKPGEPQERKEQQEPQKTGGSGETKEWRVWSEWNKKDKKNNRDKKNSRDNENGFTLNKPFPKEGKRESAGNTNGVPEDMDRGKKEQKEQERWEQEKQEQEIEEFIHRSRKKTRTDLQELMKRLENQDFAEETLQPYMEQLQDRLREIDERTLDELCENFMQKDFNELADLYHTIADGNFLPEIKEHRLEMLAKRLARIKCDECELLIQKLKNEMEGSIVDNPRHHFYPARRALLNEAEPEEVEIINDALDTYAANRNKFEYPILVVDTSRNGSGREGMILTPERLYCSTFLNAYYVPVSDIEAIKISSGLWNRTITAERHDGVKLKIPFAVSSGEVKKWGIILSEFIQYLKEKPQSRQIPYLVKEKHEKICCYRCGFQYKGSEICPECGYKNNR